MYTLKSIFKRGTLLGAAGALLVAAVLPGAAAFADELNPLTERSLMLSSSAPGFTDTDGSGNSTAAPNAVNENYAVAGSGPNGKKTGETFTFKVSSNATVRGFSLQYCTTAAGNCQAPGDNPGDADPNNDGDTADSTRADNLAAHALTPKKSDFDFEGAFTQGTGAGQFQVYKSTDGGTTSTAVASTWTIAKANLENTAHLGTLTGKNNYITLTSTGGEALNNGDQVKIVFRPSESIYITNPGSGSFFVKINTYNSATVLKGTHNEPVAANHTVIDGGVTVANVMTDSIHITTKVLETMAFSVGTRNRDMQTLNCGADFGTGTQPAGCEANTGAVHGTCSPIQNVNNNRLNLGNPDAEYSLETTRAWDVASYWRLSSNSSGGATVYYSGNTLANTVGDEISDMPAEAASTPGTEQFGLGFVAPEVGSQEFRDARPTITISSKPFVTLATGQAGTQGFPLNQNAAAAYDEASGEADATTGSDLYKPNASPGTAKFKFLKSSLTSPEPIAQQNSEVISCATAKMRYVGNIGADTPAGVYTTKINYLAAPQY